MLAREVDYGTRTGIVRIPLVVRYHNDADVPELSKREEDRIVVAGRTRDRAVGAAGENRRRAEREGREKRLLAGDGGLVAADQQKRCRTVVGRAGIDEHARRRRARPGGQNEAAVRRDAGEAGLGSRCGAGANRGLDLGGDVGEAGGRRQRHRDIQVAGRRASVERHREVRPVERGDGRVREAGEVAAGQCAEVVWLLVSVLQVLEVDRVDHDQAGCVVDHAGNERVVVLVQRHVAEDLLGDQFAVLVAPPDAHGEGRRSYCGIGGPELDLQAVRPRAGIDALDVEIGVDVGGAGRALERNDELCACLSGARRNPHDVGLAAAVVEERLHRVPHVVDGRRQSVAVGDAAVPLGVLAGIEQQFRRSDGPLGGVADDYRRRRADSLDRARAARDLLDIDARMKVGRHGLVLPLVSAVAHRLRQAETGAACFCEITSTLRRVRLFPLRRGASRGREVFRRDR